MSVGRRIVLSGLIWGAVIRLGFFSFVPQSFAGECPGGARPATDDDAAVMNGRIEKGACYNPSDAVIGQAAESAKEWLRKHASKVSNISCLDAEFAQKVKRFMEAVPGGPPTIISAYRPPEAQVALVRSGASKAGPCQSYHNYGLAVDFNNTSQISWMRANSWTYGINIIGAWDPNHFQDARGRFGQCGQCSNYKGDGALSEPSSTPSRTLSDQIRQALGMQPPPPPPPPPMQPQPALPHQPKLPEQPTLPTQSPSSSVSTQITPISDLININTNDNTNTKSTSSPTSTIDLIKEFLDPVSDSIDIGKAVDIDLNPDTSDATSLDARKPTSTRVSATSSTYGNLNVPQTFTTNDLSKGPVAGYIVGENTFILRVLDAMKNTLLLALNYLKPFGGYEPGTVPPGTSSAYAD